MLPGYDFGDEFEFGLDLVLDGIARMLETTDLSLTGSPARAVDVRRSPSVVR